MAEKQKQTVVIDSTEYNIEDFNEQQVALVNHVADLDRKIGNARFNLDQLSVGREAFFNMLKQSLETEAE